MVQFRLMIVALIIGVLQACTAFLTKEERDATKLFSADELQRAKDAGLPLEPLVKGKLYLGLTFDEMIKLHELEESAKSPKQPVAPEDMHPLCQILVPELKMPTSYTSTQEAHLPKLVALMNRLEDRYDNFRFLRATVCSYLGQPDKFEMEANSFGLLLAPYMELRFMTMKAEKAKGGDRVKVVKQMCCLNKHRDDRNEAVMLGLSTFTALPDEEMNEFAEHWTQYEFGNTLKSFENICDFLDTKDQTKDSCIVVIPERTDVDHE